MWKGLVLAAVLLVSAVAALSLVYYLCVWRGGRVHYQPQHDLSSGMWTIWTPVNTLNFGAIKLLGKISANFWKDSIVINFLHEFNICFSFGISFSLSFQPCSSLYTPLEGPLCWWPVYFSRSINWHLWLPKYKCNLCWLLQVDITVNSWLRTFVPFIRQ